MPAAPPDEDKIPLLDVLHDLGRQLPQSDLPKASEVQQLLGAVVKVMEHGGVEVADELWPPEPAAVERPDTADQVHRQKTNARLDSIESALADLLAHLKGSA